MTSRQASDAPVRAPGTRSRSGNAMLRTRVALLDATAACIERYGVRKTTMVDVASRSGVAKATLYNHFRTKADVLAALVEATVADLVATALQTAATRGPAAALAEAVTALSVSEPLRKAAVEEPALVAPLLVPGEARAWTTARDGVGAVLAAGRLEADPQQVDLVLRWLVSHVAWPATPEQAAAAAAALVRGLGVPPPRAEGLPALVEPAPAGSPPGVGWPG